MQKTSIWTATTTILQLNKEFEIADTKEQSVIKAKICSLVKKHNIQKLPHSVEQWLDICKGGKSE